MYRESRLNRLFRKWRNACFYKCQTSTTSGNWSGVLGILSGVQGILQSSKTISMDQKKLAGKCKSSHPKSLIYGKERAAISFLYCTAVEGVFSRIVTSGKCGEGVYDSFSDFSST